MNKFYWLPNCSTCVKAKKFLDANNIEINELRDIKADKLSRAEVEKLVELIGDADKLFSRRAIKYRELGLNKREVSTAEMLDLITDEYTFIKRPVLVIDGAAIAGFSEKVWNAVVPTAKELKNQTFRETF
jgi:arsenate reductase (glutaredoxin)